MSHESKLHNFDGFSKKNLSNGPFMRWNHAEVDNDAIGANCVSLKTRSTNWMKET